MFAGCSREETSSTFLLVQHSERINLHRYKLIYRIRSYLYVAGTFVEATNRDRHSAGHDQSRELNFPLEEHYCEYGALSGEATA